MSATATLVTLKCNMPKKSIEGIGVTEVAEVSVLLAFQTERKWTTGTCRQAHGTSWHDTYVAEGYFRRKRNSVPIAAIAWLSRTWLARAKTIVSST